MDERKTQEMSINWQKGQITTEIPGPYFSIFCALCERFFYLQARTKRRRINLLKFKKVVNYGED